MGHILADSDNPTYVLTPVLAGKSSLAVPLLREKGVPLGTVCNSGISCLQQYLGGL
jgi:hypothetical protein